MYIRSTAAISPQASFEALCAAPAVYAGDKLSCIEPDYTQYVDVKQIRRMSRIIKMGVAAAMECLKQTNVEQPGAIITGTAYGCLAEYFTWAQETGVITPGDANTRAKIFLDALTGDLQLRCLLGLAKRPSKAEKEHLAAETIATFINGLSPA